MGPAMLDDCAICCNSYTDFARYGCGHRLCCRCAARLLYLYSDRKCPICKESKMKPLFDSVAVEVSDSLASSRDGKKDGRSGSDDTVAVKCTARHRLLDSDELSFSSRLSSMGSLKIKDLEDSYASYANHGIRSRVKGLLAIRCKECKHTFGTRKELVQHFRSKHSSLLCATCVENGHQFWYEHSSYTPETLSQHRKGQLKEPGFDGHVYCTFCSFYLYGKDAAKKHCDREHQLCTVCDILGSKCQYYRNFSDLETHYRSQHFCCTSPVCIKNLCYVYAYKSELWTHSMSHHGMEMQLSDIVPGSEKNPQVFSLSERRPSDEDEESVYRTGTNVLSPLVSSPFFPTFSRAATAEPRNVQGCVPSFLDRRILHQAESSSKQRVVQVGSIVPMFCTEVCAGIEKYIAGMKSVGEMVCEIEDAVGKIACLRILENVSFLQKQRDVGEFLVGYKKEMKFPSFKKAAARDKEQEKQIGFKMLDASRPRKA